MTQRVCLTCRQWEAAGVPAYAAAMGLAFCVIKNTRAVMLAHWRMCGHWAATDGAAVDRRVAWLKRRGVEAVLQQ